MSLFHSILINILVAVYQSFWFALVLSIFFMFVWKHYQSAREAAKQWMQWFQSDLKFRQLFLLVFYSTMILFRTLLNRNMWMNPLSDVFGIWGLHDAEGNHTTEAPENLVLFIPFTILLLWTYRDKILNKVTLLQVLWQSTKIVFLFSFTIEMLQLFLRLGTWQLSDLFYNTMGGFVGGLMYWIGYKVKHRESGI